MKETGLMFKAPLVRAILDGSKTQTRRIAKLPHMNPLGEWEAATVGGPDGGRTRDGNTAPLQTAIAHTRTGEVICAPFQPGDRIYVRETWQGPLLEEFESDADSDWMSPSRIHQYQNPAHCQYAADGGPAPEFITADDNLVRRWRPAIHMPKWAARIWLEITGVRVERLQTISRGDAEREGVECKDGSDEPYGKGNRDGFRYRNYLGKKNAFDCSSACASFRTLWESTGGDWTANPWVWVIDLKRVEQPTPKEPA